VVAKYDRAEPLVAWHSFPWFLLTVLLVALAAAGASWGVLYALRRTGMQRLAGLDTSSH
jgi:hypothetical protein